MSKFLKILLYVLFGISGLIVILFYTQNSTGAFALANINSIMASTTMVDGLMLWTYLLVGAAVVTLLGLSIASLINNPKALKRAGFTALIAVVIIGLSYVLASGDPIPVNIDEVPGDSTFKLTDAGLIITYLLFGASILLLLGGSIRNAISNRK